MINKIKTKISSGDNEKNFKKIFSKNKKIFSKNKKEIDELVLNKKRRIFFETPKDIYEKVSSYDKPIYFDYEEKFRVRKILDESMGEFSFGNNKLVYYYVNIDRVYGDSLSNEKKIKYATLLRLEDEKEENARRILHSTPMLVEKEVDTILYDERAKKDCVYTGESLKFYDEEGVDYYFPLAQFIYNYDTDGLKRIKAMSFPSKEKKEEIIKNVCRYYADIKEISNSYTNYYKDLISEHVTQVCLGYVPEQYQDNLAGYYGLTSNVNSRDSHVFLNMQFLEDEYDEMIITYTHELTHAFDWASSSSIDITSTSEWNDIYNQIVEMQPEGLWDYAFSEPAELLAESVSEYYSTDLYPDYYNPNDLKAITIEVDGVETTLYDYIDSILKCDKRAYIESATFNIFDLFSL